MRCLLPVATGLYLVGLLLTGSAETAAQPTFDTADDAGRYPLTAFAADDYEAHVQNWAAQHLPDGTMAFANTSGVLLFDGTHWTRLPMPNGGLVRSLAQDETGRVYVGAEDEIGYLASDSLGAWRYVSLAHHIPDTLRPFGNVWSIATTADGVYFQTNDALVRWSPEADTARIWRAAERFVQAFSVRDTLYVAAAGVGLLQRDSARDTLTALPGTEALADRVATVALPLGPRALLLGTRDQGLFRYDGTTLEPFPTEANDHLREHLLYRGIALPDGRFAFATLRGGVLFLRGDGTIERILDERDGLPTNTVTNLFADPAGHLWLPLNEGIARLDWPAPFSIFDEDRGLPGIVEAITRHAGRLYAATDRGIFMLTPVPRRAAQFVPIEGISIACRSLLSTANGLLAGCGDGLYRIRASQATRLFQSPALHDLAQAPFDATLVLAASGDGLRRVRWQGSRWSNAGRIDGIAREGSSIALFPDGTAWMGLRPQGVVQVEGLTGDAPRVTRFRAGAQGLPTGVVTLARGTEQPLFLTETGLYRYRSGTEGARGRFAPDRRFGPMFSGYPDGAPGRSVLTATADPQGALWMFAWPDVGIARPHPDGTFAWTAAPFFRARMPFVYAIHRDADGTVWFGGTDGIVRHDPRRARLLPTAPRALVRRMTPVGRDSLLHAGAPDHHPVLPFTENAVRFTYALPSFFDPARHTFQVQLDGFDPDWSDWTTETQKDYTNLPEGRYTFRVRGRDAAGRISPEGRVAFTVQPPWYRTGWAYLLWGLLGLGLAGGIGYGAVRWRTRQLEARSRALEAEVAARTEEIHRQNAQLAEQAERLAALDAVKSRFFANISHEFRTPLTLTLGPVEDILSGAHGPVPASIEDRLQLVYRNANRLLRLINQLLDLARLETGHMELAATPIDLVETLDDIVLAFTPLAERRKITLTFKATTDRLRVYVDPDKLEKIAANLLSNAFKATEAGDHICVRVRDTEDHAEIAVDDTGVGIPPEDLPHIFDRFAQQAETQHGGAGTGIGLNLTKEFVELHGGTIDVTSTPDVGTTFTVCLPLGRAHLRDEQIVEDTAPAPHALASAAPAPARPDAPDPAADAPTSEQPTVLVVDDNPDIRAYVRAHLEPDYHVAEAADGVEGVEQAQALLPDCIVADVMMPRQDGYALAEQLKADPDLNHVPLILLTARAEEADKIEGLTVGADDYLTKPFNARELVLRIHNQIAARHRLREKFRDTVVLAPSEVEIESADAQFLEGVKAVIEAHLTDETFGVPDLAASVALSESQLQRRVKALTDQTPVQLIRTMRLERAAQLLEQETGTITEIAYAVGFNSYAHFARSFKQHFNCTASEYVAEAS